MKNQLKYYLPGIIIIMFSSTLGYETLNIIYMHKNLTGSFDMLLNGFINSYTLIGILIFSIGILESILNSKNCVK